MKVAKVAFALLLVALMANVVLAQAGGGGRRGGGGGFMMGGGTASALDRLVSAVKRLDGITDDQKAKVDAVAKDYAPKFKDLRDKAANVLTADQKKAVEDAMKAARALPTDASREDRRAAFTKVGDVMNGLSQEQKDKRAAIQKDVQTLVTEVRGKIDPILTEAQKTQLQQNMNRRPGGGQGKRGGAAQST